MKSRQVLLALAFALALVGAIAHTTSAAVQYLDPLPPLENVVTDSVGDVDMSGTVRTPIILWGGDIATIHGNGASMRTQRGSIYHRLGLDLELFREDDFATQVGMYMRGEIPVLRGTVGMINSALDVISADPRTVPVLFYQLTWSTGGDALVVKDSIKKADDICGTTGVVQAFGPHVDYVSRYITDTCGYADAVTIKWGKKLEHAAVAFAEDKAVQWASVIIPDALKLTSQGTVWQGGEGSVKGSRILHSTKTMRTIISDVYAVRSDVLQSHPEWVFNFAYGSLQATHDLKQLVKDKKKKAAAYKTTFQAAAVHLLGGKTLIPDAEGLYADCTFVGFPGQIEFFLSDSYPRNYIELTSEVQLALADLGLLMNAEELSHAELDYDKMKSMGGIGNVKKVNVPVFNRGELNRVIQARKEAGTLADGQLFFFEANFDPAKSTVNVYQLLGHEKFKDLVRKLSTYGGAAITVEGHSDPLEYLRAKKEGKSQLEITKILTSAKNLSMRRATSAAMSIIKTAKQKFDVHLDISQFARVGHSLWQPKNGMCGQDPCPPSTETEWRANMRIEFRMVEVEVEASVFRPLQ